jgi:hypothetical protein
MIRLKIVVIKATLINFYLFELTVVVRACITIQSHNERNTQNQIDSSDQNAD